MSTQVLLIRHAESEMQLQPHLICGRSTEAGLTEKGEYQAQKLGELLLNASIIPTDVYSSPSLRTRETARLSLQAMGLSHMPVTQSDDVQELSQGAWEKQPRVEIYTDEIKRDIKFLGKDYAAPGGESMNDVGYRMHNWLQGTEAREGLYFVYTHGFAIRCLVSQLLDWSHDKTFQEEVSNVSITHLAHDDGWQVVSFAKDIVR